MNSKGYFWTGENITCGEGEMKFECEEEIWTV